MKHRRVAYRKPSRQPFGNARLSSSGYWPQQQTTYGHEVVMRAAKQSNRAATAAAAPPRIAAEFCVVVLQLIFALSAALLCLLTDNAWRSALLGALCVLLPTAYAAWRSRGLPELAHRLWSSMLAIEIQKLLFTAALFAMCFIVLQPQSPIIFFAAVIGCQAMYLAAAASSKPGARTTAKTGQQPAAELLPSGLKL